jgi:hypothetical protein
MSGLVGCGGGGGDHPATVPVTGTVTYNGTPVDDATVTFSPSADGHPAIGKTDARGEFSLMTQWGTAGAVPGSYKVTVSKTEVQATEATEVEVEAAPIDEGELFESVERLPEKYKSVDSTDLTAEVKAEGGNTFAFDLTD